MTPRHILPGRALALAGIALVVGFAAPAMAAGAAPASRGGPGYEQQRSDMRQINANQMNARRAAQQCEPMCPYDTLPCDPINFKIADGRCSNGIRSGR